MKRVALYSPYFPKHSGGGEKYLLSIAEVCSKSAETCILVPPSQVEEARKGLLKAESLFGLSLGGVKVLPTKIGSGKNPVGIARETAQFDILFAMTDGSIFPSLAKQSYLIIQVPWTRPLKFSERLKLMTWKKIIVYSEFVRERLQSSWMVEKIRVLSPFVDLKDFPAVPIAKKEKLIINVGRFFSHSQSNSKRQDILIEAFKSLIDTYHVKGWHLSLLGNVDPNPDSITFLHSLKEKARGYPISIHTDLHYDALRSYYAQASIYWHAAGFGVLEERNPENTEHFGMTTLEAMASGCVPFVIPKGGQKEIVGKAGLFWDTIPELVNKTASFITVTRKEHAVWEELSHEMVSQSKKYSKSAFEREIELLLE